MKNLIIVILLFLISFPLKAKEVNFTCDCKRQVHMYTIPNSQNPDIENTSCAEIYQFSIDINKSKIHGVKSDLIISEDKVIWGEDPKPFGQGATVKSTFNRFTGTLETIFAIDQYGSEGYADFKYVRITKYTCNKGKKEKLL